MSFFAELKRRNVFRVGIAYLVVAWLVMQVADVVINNIGAPDWVFGVIMLVVGIGFPVVLVFAWAFELTPDGIKKEKDVDHSQSLRAQTGHKLNYLIIGALALVAVYFFWEARFEKGAAAPTATVQQVAETDPRRADEGDPARARKNSIAVLPFVNMSSSPEQEYFSDGITEEIINAVVKIPGLSVPARTSVFGFKGHQGDVRDVGRQLNVSYILEGSIRSQANQVRITAQLIKVDDGYHLWSETFDRQLDNIFAVQEEIATAIAGVLTGQLGMDVETVPNKTRNMQAYDHYLHGRVLLRRRGLENLDQAVALFQRTIELDPEFAPAWAAMALAYSVMDLSYDVLEKAISTAEHALSLDPDNVDALDALASALRDSWRWAEAEPYFERAMSIDPQSSELLEDYAEFLGMVGRFDEYLSVSEKGYAIDPLLGPLADAYMWALMIEGRFNEAIEVIEQWNRSTNQEDILPFWQEAYWKIIPLIASGNNAGAIQMVEALAPEHGPAPVKKAIIGLLENPEDEQARSTLRATFTTNDAGDYDSAMYMSGLILIHSGDIDFMIDFMISQIRESRFGNQEPIWSPIYSQFRQHPRFEEYLELLNLPGYWDEKGWPDICRRDENERVFCK
jgi:TolB-like protein/tetratricopeptide (TPR) repeat protein